MKFGRVLERARQLGFDAVATGHHARVVDTPDGLAIGRGADAAKDQSYVLYMLGPEQLRAHAASRRRADEGRGARARVCARSAHRDKPESMDVCFITKGGREAFLGDAHRAAPGAIVDTDGTELGGHDGIDAFTIGQRRGLGVAVGERRYVIDIAPSTGTVTLGTRDDLLRDRVTITDATWTFGAPPAGEVLAQSRAHGAPVRARARRRRRRVRDAAAARRAGPGGRAATTMTSCSAAASRAPADDQSLARRRPSAVVSTSARRIGAMSTMSVSTIAPSVRPRRREKLAGSVSAMVRLPVREPSRRSSARSSAGSAVVGPMPAMSARAHEHRVERGSADRRSRRRRGPARTTAATARAANARGTRRAGSRRRPRGSRARRDRRRAAADRSRPRRRPGRRRAEPAASSSGVGMCSGKRTSSP